ncbi:3-mercaptopyruvate sulfurtransferase [Rhodoblastus sp.]|uniref:3-mercaptopyruvate sulfurtransferase n=1 Tax=Rhodoblastus sp. TaxID=1962975 RepID=UPI003F9A8160
MSETHFVSTDWLSARLGAPGIAIVDASWHMPDANRNAAEEFRARRIPGAVFFDIDAIADTSTGLPHMLPDPVAFSSAMRKLGIGDGFSIVVYDSLGLFSAPRVWWTFRAFGKRDVFILDGGLPKWLAEGRRVAEDEACAKTSHFTCRLDHRLVASRDDVKAASARAGQAGAPQIVDARSAARCRGEDIEPRPGVRRGRIPGSFNLHWEGLVTDGRLKPRQELADAFAAAKVDISRPILTTCGSGVTAAILSLALAELGRETAPVYDGSWADWGACADLPLATGPL